MKPLYRFSILLSAAAVFALAACEEKKPQVTEKPTPATTNIETSKLGTAIDSYVRTPTTENAADVDRAFADLDGEIAELDQRISQTTGDDRAKAEEKAVNLKTYRDKERVRYTEAQARAKADEAKTEVKDAGERVEGTAEKVGESVKNAAETVGDAVKDAGEAVKERLP